MNEQQAVNRIHQLDFVLVELELYLDTHPADRKALTLRMEMKKRRTEALAAYEKEFGHYNETAAGTVAGEYWNWIKSPWPWEGQVNL